MRRLLQAGAVLTTAPAWSMQRAEAIAHALEAVSRICPLAESVGP